MIDVFMLPGTGWPHGGDGVTEDFLARLDTRRFRPVIVPYPAEFGQRMSYRESVEMGKTALREAVRATPNLAVIGGYSQGAVIAGDLAAEIGDGLHPELELAGVALIADGARPVGGRIRTAPTEGYGILGERHINDEDFPVWWAAAIGDPITALPVGNPLRTLPPIVEWMSVRTPNDVLLWGSKVLDAAVTRRFQPWWNPANWRTWNGALAYARGYLFDGRHGAAYINEGLNQALADAVNSIEE